MSRRQRGRPVHGVVLLDKPRGPSSNQAMQKVRALFDARKAGHTGSLDPFATGMLPICLGEATKTAAFMLDADKTYRATARLGDATSTGDLEGVVVRTGLVPDMTVQSLELLLASFVGEISQLPPMYSALKHQGRPLYEYARQGVSIERRPRTVTIHYLRLVDWRAPEIEFEVRCSKGTYVRTLAEDIADAMGTFAHLVALRRLSVAPFTDRTMVALDTLAEAAVTGRLTDFLLPPDAGLVHIPVLFLSDADSAAFAQGALVQCEAADGWVRAYDASGCLLGLGECHSAVLQPRRVMQVDPPDVA